MNEKIRNSKNFKNLKEKNSNSNSNAGTNADAKYDEFAQYKTGGVSREKLMESFSKSIKCGIMCVCGDEIAGSVNSCECQCELIQKSRKVGHIDSSPLSECKKMGEYCFEVHRYAGSQSEKFGGKYIYFCPSGFVFIICPISRGYDSYNNYGDYNTDDDGYNGYEEYNDDKMYFTAGPISPVNCDDFDIEELINALDLDLTLNEALDLVKDVPVVQSDLITHIANLLYVCSRQLSLSEGELIKAIKNNEIYEQQNQIGEYIQNVKAALIKESQSYISYPYDKEKQLVYAIVSNDLANSRRYLNEILGHIFFSSANNLDVIKVRAMELSVMISRAALDGGADQSKIFDINIKFISEFFNYKTIEEVCWALTDILRKFTKETFEFSKVKHVDLISKAVSYVKTNYMRKLTLSEAAAYVFLSPSYFSKIFKEEMGYYFNDYLNYVRVEKSKIYC